MIHVIIMGGWAQTTQQYEWLSAALKAVLYGEAIVHICEQQGGLDRAFSQLDALEASARAEQRLWIGCSLGGTILLEWLTRRIQPINAAQTDQAGQVVLFGCNPHFLSVDDWPGVTDELLSNMSASLRVDSRRTLQRFNQLQCLGLEPARQKQAVRWLNSTLPSLSPEQLEEGLGLLETLDAREALNAIREPALMLFGQHDQLAGPSVLEALKKQASSSGQRFEELLDTAHVIDEVASQLIAERIAKWLRSGCVV